MSEVNTNPSVETEDDDLDQFADEFFGQDESAPEPAKSEADAEDADDEVDASEEDDTQEELGEDDSPATEDDDDDGSEEGSDDPKPAPKKNRAQERIDELTAKYREEERQRIALEDRLRKLEEGQNKQDEPEPKDTGKVETEDSMPKPTDKDDDGKEKYPLGEFDPKYLADLVDYRVNTALEANAEKAKQQEQENQVSQARAELQQDWEGRLQEAVQKAPDFLQKTESLIESLGEVGDDYGEYIATTIMSMENGTDVLYHLANNPAEAKEILDSGATAATLALGRLDARFGGDEPKPTPKASKPSSAPVPPPVNKGSSVAKPQVDPDTEDLDSFEKMFFKK